SQKASVQQSAFRPLTVPKDDPQRPYNGIRNIAAIFRRVNGRNALGVTSFDQKCLPTFAVTTALLSSQARLDIGRRSGRHETPMKSFKRLFSATPEGTAALFLRRREA